MLLLNQNNRLEKLREFIKVTLVKEKKVPIINCRKFEDINLLFDYLDELGARWPTGSLEKRDFVFYYFKKENDKDNFLSLTINLVEGSKVKDLIVRYTISTASYYEEINLIDREDYAVYEF